MVLTSGGFGLILGAVFGATVASGEFRHRTATDTYLDEPNRLRVLLAKAVAAALVGLVFGLVGTAVTSGVGLAFVAAGGYQVALPATTIARFAAGAVVGSGLLAAVGVGLGSLIRGQIGATIAVLVWGFGIEQLLGGLSRSVAPACPTPLRPRWPAPAAARACPSFPPGCAHCRSAPVAALLFGVAVLISTVAAVTTVQRDVS